MVKKDIIEYRASSINLSQFLKLRIEFFDEIAYGNDIKIVHDILPDIYISFNDIQLQRICDNTISNAIKYAYSNSEIYIILFEQNDNIILTIQNNGDNIKEPDKLFHRYYRENESRGGFGIGLNIIKEICEKTDVGIVINSQDNQTIFRYEFKKEGLL